MASNEFIQPSSELRSNGHAKSANLAHATANMTHAKEKLSESADAALKGVVEMLEAAGYEVKKQGIEGRIAAEEYIKLNPLRAMGFAMLAGAVTALLLKR